MKKLYDEIMGYKITNPSDELDHGYNGALDDCAELAKKYDDEIERLREALSYWSDGVDS